MLKRLSFLSGFKRITTSNRYIPEIDGIRFVAILLVVLYHINIYVQAKDTNTYKDESAKLFLEKYLFSGHLGVELFFVLSGFILSIPFASHYLLQSEKPSLKKFYCRRLTRLEPPYVLMMTLLGITLFAMHKFSGFVLLKSFTASLTYTHNFFYPGIVPLINGVAWSLEVEFQFYFLAPFLCYIFSLEKQFRRMIIASSIVLLIVLQFLYLAQTVSLFLYLQYFLLGFLLSDFYISKDYKEVKDIVSIPLGLVSLLCIMIMPHEKTLTALELLLAKLYLIISIFVFFYMAIFSHFWKSILSIPFVSTVGGMCYSIYLIHFPIINFIGKPLIARLNFSNYYLVNFIIVNVILLASILLLSALFYKKIERPCMKADWFSQLVNRIRRTNYQA